MTSSPHRLGVSAGALMALLLLGAFLPLPPVTGGGVKKLKCMDSSRKGSVSCGDQKACCFRQMLGPVQPFGCKSESTKGGCPKGCVEEKDNGLLCYCTEKNCNEKTDKNDPVYDKGPSTRNNMALISALLLVLVALTSHLL